MGATRREHAAAKRAFVMYDKVWNKTYASAVMEWLRKGQYEWRKGGGNG